MLDSCRVLEAEGIDVTYLPVQSNGLIKMEVGIYTNKKDNKLKIINNRSAQLDYANFKKMYPLNFTSMMIYF